MPSQSTPLLFYLLLSAAVGGVGPASLPAGEVLVTEGFEKFDPKALPPGWSTGGKEISVAASTADRGKVLRVSNAKGEAAALTFTIDLAKAAGSQVRFNVLAQFPGAYTAPADKTWAKPRVSISAKPKEGKDVTVNKVPAPGKPEWQPLSATIAVPKDAQKVTLQFRSDGGPAEVFYDNLTIEIDPDLNAPPPPIAVAAGTKAADVTPAMRSAAAPRTVLEDGVIFNSEIAAQLQKRFAKPTATAKSILLVGPGLPNKEFDAKAPAGWTLLQTPKEAAGPAAGANALLIALAEPLTAHKPEVVILIADGVNRKASPSEEFDWADVARLCLRLGAVPVFGIPGSAGGSGPAAAAVDEGGTLRKAMQEATDEAGCPAIELKAPSVVPKRIAEVTTLLEKHVFCRVPLDAPASGVAPKKVIDE